MRAAIAGNPNSGKTSLFNALTGSYHAVGNYPGVTVERREGYARGNGCIFRVVDLPGTYSLTAYSAEEEVARNFVIEQRPDVVVDVVDAANLERNLYLAVQIIEMEAPLVVALNMIDVARRRRLDIDVDKLSSLLGVPVVATQAHRGVGTRELLAACAQVAADPERHIPKQIRYGHHVDEQVGHLAGLISHDEGLRGRFRPRWLAVKLIEKDSAVADQVASLAADPGAIRAAADHAIHSIETHFGEHSESVIAEGRHGFAAGVVRECLRLPTVPLRTRTDRIDSVTCHRVGGPIILVCVVYGLFVSVFKVADEWSWLFGKSPTEWMEWAFERLAESCSSLQARAPLLHSLLTDGIIGGVGGVMAFVPLILVMFAFVAVLEDTGYVARVAFVMDRLLKVFGLQGKSILAMIVSGGLGGGGCAVPGVMATRTLREEKDRLVTMLVAPLMNCGAKMPVYLMLIAAFFPRIQARILFVVWLMSWIVALGAAWVLRKAVVRGEQTPFVMELPPYHVPTLRGVLMHTWERTWAYVRKAGTVILAVSVIMWFLMYFPRVDASPFEERIAVAQAELGGEELVAVIQAIRNDQATAQLRNSVAGRLGSGLVPVSQWAGFDWRTNISLIGGFAAKELVVGTFGVAYSMGNVDPDATDSLSNRLATDPQWSRVKAFALIMFVMVYAPCMATQVTIWRESGSVRWALFSTAYATLLGFALAVLVYQGGLALGLGQ
ncbi:MAG: ferrous iron transport protein B [Phycisphaerales bacterium]|nr:MAG: ferrous iron transport protein B [Phycisphaerales bacterium]